MSIYLQILSLFFGIIVSVITIFTLLIKFSDKLLTKVIIKVIEKLDIDNLSSNSELVQDHHKVSDLDGRVTDLENVCDTVKKSVTILSELKSDINDIKVDRFKNSLRERIEYTITKKGKVDRTYWDYIVSDYNHYTNDLKLNTYMSGIYSEAEKLYVKSNVKHEDN